VVGVSDGDTVTLLDHAKTQYKIRLHGIDAPEKGQEFGERSKESLSRLAFSREVTARCHKRDRYSREICKIMLGSTDVNLEQIRAGMAWWYREYAKEQLAEDRPTYADARGSQCHDGAPQHVRKHLMGDSEKRNHAPIMP
jgi:endonuclease YncB( thermonuclease family)